MLDLLVTPEQSLGNEQWDFVLGMPINQAILILQKQCRVIKDINVVYNDRKPFESDIVLNLTQDGIKLVFDSKNQRLKVIEVFDLSRVRLKYNGVYFNTPELRPTTQRIDSVFGSTKPPQLDEKHQMYLLSFRGIAFLFPKEPHQELHPYLSVVARMTVFAGNHLGDAHPPEIPPSCYHGNLYSDHTEVVLEKGRCVGLELSIASIGVGGILQPQVKQVRFKDCVQDVLSEIGNPCHMFYKLEDKMRIHSAGPHKLSSAHSDYFYNYLTLGVDILFDGDSHLVKKFILHSNHPGHYNFNIYNRCRFKVELQGDKRSCDVTPITKWDTVVEGLGLDIGEPVVLNRASSTNTTNPFGSTYCYGIRNMIFEVMASQYIASVTLYDNQQ